MSGLRGRTLEERFWSFVEKKSDNECWNWIGSKDACGYGIFHINEKKGHRSHRFSWMIKYGEIPKKMLVCHKCDNPSCVNPNHLFLGTYLDNNTDKKLKGRCRSLNGERHPMSKFKSLDIKNIRESKLTGRALSKIYGVNPSTISCIKLNKTWKGF